MRKDLHIARDDRRLICRNEIRTIDSKLRLEHLLQTRKRLFPRKQVVERVGSKTDARDAPQHPGLFLINTCENGLKLSRLADADRNGSQQLFNGLVEIKFASHFRKTSESFSPAAKDFCAFGLQLEFLHVSDRDASLSRQRLRDLKGRLIKKARLRSMKVHQPNGLALIHDRHDQSRYHAFVDRRFSVFGVIGYNFGDSRFDHLPLDEGENVRERAANRKGNMRRERRVVSIEEKNRPALGASHLEALIPHKFKKRLQIGGCV